MSCIGNKMQGFMCHLCMYLPFMDADVVCVDIIYGSIRRVRRYNLGMHVPLMDAHALEGCMSRFYIGHGCMCSMYVCVHVCV